MKPSIFISRKVAPESDFLSQLPDYQIIGESLIEFKPIPFSSVPEVDWVFFYSKKAIQFFFENVRREKLQLDVKWAVFGKGTAEALAQELHQADFVGIGDPASNAIYFGQIAQGQRVLFPQAANSQQSIQKLLANQIKTFDLIVYDNQPRSDFNLPFCHWLVFTSPMNAEAYFAKYTLQPEQKILAIGKTTAAALQQLGIANVTIAEEPSEMALAQAIRKATLL